LKKEIFLNKDIINKVVYQIFAYKIRLRL
jgi:hypothetical protein